MQPQKIPFPSNDRPVSRFDRRSESNSRTPWKKLESGYTPMCFEVRYRNGEVQAFPYSDFRGYQLQHEGYLVIKILGMQKSVLIVEGRWLSQLARHLSMGGIEWFGEISNALEVPESEPYIERITLEDLTGP